MKTSHRPLAGAFQTTTNTLPTRQCQRSIGTHSGRPLKHNAPLSTLTAGLTPPSTKWKKTRHSSETNTTAHRAGQRRTTGTVILPVDLRGPRRLRKQTFRLPSIHLIALSHDLVYKGLHPLSTPQLPPITVSVRTVTSSMNCSISGPARGGRTGGIPRSRETPTKKSSPLDLGRATT